MTDTKLGSPRNASEKSERSPKQCIKQEADGCADLEV
jgi:hypothetical protein